MTENERKEAINCINTQLENDYVDVGGVHYENEIEVIRQACLINHYNNDCNKCEYYMALILLEEVLKENDYCDLCKNCDRIKGGYHDCVLNQERNKDCNFEIDWERAFKEYGIDIER